MRWAPAQAQTPNTRIERVPSSRLRRVCAVSGSSAAVSTTTTLTSPRVALASPGQATQYFLQSDTMNTSRTAHINGPSGFHEYVYIAPIQFTAFEGVSATGDAMSLLAFCVDIYHDISLGTLNHASGAFDRVVLQSLDGRIVDANGSGAIDLTADEIVLRGLGVAEGSSGDVLEVDADRIVIDVDGGVVFQDVAADGTVRFMVMHEGVLYTQLINHGTATRGTDAVDPDGDDFVNLVGGGAGLSNLSATLGLFSSSAAIFQVHSAASPMTASYLAGKASVGSDENDLALWIGDQDLLTDEYGIDPDMLGEDILSATAFSTGQSGDENFYSEYWVESLSL